MLHRKLNISNSIQCNFILVKVDNVTQNCGRSTAVKICQWVYTSLKTVRTLF